MNRPLIKCAVSVPARKYNVIIKNASIRRLTIMEWIILRTINQFSVNRQYWDISMSEFLEGPLGMVNCEQLLKPCVESLRRMQLITIDHYVQSGLVGRKKLNEFHLTDKGMDAVKRSYIPGEYAENEAAIVHNLVTEQYLSGNSERLKDTSHKPSNSFMRHNDYDVVFPAEDIAYAINTGALFSEQYKENYRIIDSVREIDEEDVWLEDLVMLFTDDGLHYDCNYPLTEEIFTLLRRVSTVPLEHSDSWEREMPESVEPSQFIAGREILSRIGKMVEYCDYCVIHSDIWNAYREQFPSEIGTTVFFVVGENEFSIEPTSIEHVVHMPCNMPQDGLILVTDNGECLFGGVTDGIIGDGALRICYAFESERRIELADWLMTVLQDNYSEHLEMLSLLSLPLLQNIPACNALLKRAFEQELLGADIINSLVLLNQNCQLLEVPPLDISQIIPLLVKAVDVSAPINAKKSLVRMYTRLLFRYESELYLRIVNATAQLCPISSFADLMEVLSAFEADKDIEGEELIQVVDGECQRLIQPEYLDELFSRFSDSIPEATPEYMTICADYNKMRNAMSYVEGTLRKYQWYSNVSPKEYMEDVINCINLSRLRDCISIIISIIQGVTRKGCSVFQENGCCEAIFNKTDELIRLINCFVFEDGEVGKVFIVETSAFIHTPDILDYFKEDETVRVPSRVLHELDTFKDNKYGNCDATVQKNAARACKNIERMDLAAREKNDHHFAIEKRDYPELLPAGIPLKNDSLILSAALRYKLFKPTIITDDTNFRNIIRTQDIQAKRWDEFILERGGAPVRTSSRAAGNTLAVYPITPPEDPQGSDVMVEQIIPQSGSESDNIVATITKEQFLLRSIEALKEAPVYLAGKHVKVLRDNGFPTLNSLFNATDSSIKSRFKAPSVRKMALQARDQLVQYVRNIYNNI